MLTRVHIAMGGNQTFNLMLIGILVDVKLHYNCGGHDGIVKLVIY
jgi:hypothetical protein